MVCIDENCITSSKPFESGVDMGYALPNILKTKQTTLQRFSIVVSVNISLVCFIGEIQWV